MKKFIVWLAVFLFAAWSSAIAAPPGAPSPWKYRSTTVLQPSSSSVQAADIGYLLLTEYTVATLPTLAAGDAGAIAAINDGDGATDCTTGGGSDRVVCRWTGSAWANAGDGTAAGSAEIVDEPLTELAYNGDTTHGVSQNIFYDAWVAIDTDLDLSLADESWLTDLFLATAGTDIIKDTHIDWGTGANQVSSDDVTAGSTNLYVTAANVGGVSDNLDDTDASIEWEDAADLGSDGSLSAGVVAAAEMADADHGAVSWTTNVATVETVTVTDNESTDEANALVFVAGADLDGATDAALESDGNLTYNPSTGTLAATIITDGTVSLAGTGAITGLAEGGLPNSTVITDDVKDNTLTASDLAAALTFADGDQIDLSGITYVDAATANEGLALPTYVANAAPADGKPYVAYDADNNVLMVYEAGGWVNTATASGAATTLNFVTTSAEGTLSAESVLDAASGETGITVAVNAGTPKTIDITFDPTELDAVTWSDSANATNAWTFDVAGTDHTMTAGDGVMTFGDAVTVTDTLTINGNITDGTATWNSSTQALSGFGTIGSGAITSTGAVTGTSFVIGSADISETELAIIDGATLSTTDINIIDGISDSGDLTAAEILYVDGVTSAIQTQLDARCLESVFGDSIEADDFTLATTTLSLVAEIPHIDATQSWSAAQTFTDGTSAIFGTGSDWAVAYDETTDDALEFSTAATASAAAGTPMFLVQANSGNGTMTADQLIFGVYNYTTKLFSVDEDGDVFINGSIITQDATDPHMIFNETTASDTDYWMGITADQEGDNDDYFDIGTGTTAGSNRVYRIDPSGNSTAEGYAKSDYLILEGGTYDTTIQPGTPTAAVSYTWPAAAPAVTGYALTGSTAGVLSWSEITATASGSAAEVQFRNSSTGALASDSAFQFNTTNNTLSITQAASNPVLQIGDGDYTWGNTPQVGIEGKLEVNDVIYADGGLTAGGAVALGANNLTMTGSLAATGARVTKGWFTDVESTNMPTVGGTALFSAIPATLANAAASTWTVVDDNASGLSIGSTGKADILKIVSTDDSEGVSMSGTLAVAGATTLSANEATLTHSGTTSLTIASTSGTVTVEDVTFTGGAVTGVTSLDVGEGDISNVGTIKADILQPDAVADGSIVVQGGQTATNTLKLQAYDVGVGFDDIITITSAAAPTLTLAADGGITASNDFTVTGTITATNYESSAADGAKFLNITNGEAISTAATTSGLLAEYGDKIYMSDGTDWDKYLIDNEAINTSEELRGLVGDESGTGALIFAGGALGAATATSINDITLTDPGETGATITLADDSTLTTAGDFTTSGAYAITLTATDTTNVTLPTTGTLATVGGALGTPSFTAVNLPTGDASPSTTAGQIRHDSTVTGLATGALAWYDGDEVRYLVDLDALPSDDDYVIAYDADNDNFYMKADSTGSAMGSNLSSSTNDITTDNSVIQFVGNSEDLDLEFGSDTADLSSDTGVATLTMTGLDLVVGGSDLSLGTAGVKLTGDGDGALTILGLGDGSDEDLTINLDDTANTAVFSSSTGVTELNFSALNMVTTGVIMGGININTQTAATYTVGTDDSNESYGTMFINGDNDAIDFTLPSAVAGMAACFMQGQGAAGAITVQPNTGDYLVVDGVRGTAATDYDSSGAAGDKLCVVAVSADDWIVTMESGTWSE